MPRYLDPRLSKRRKSDDDEEDEEEESSESTDNDERIEFFIPSQGIDVEPLAFYLREYVDNRATIDPGRGKKINRDGYIITARWTLSRAGLKDILNDSKDWLKEKDTRAYQKHSYRYTASETAKRRRKVGPAPDRKVHISKPKQEAESSRPLVSQQRHGNAPTLSTLAGLQVAGNYDSYRQDSVRPTNSRLNTSATQPIQSGSRHAQRYTDSESGAPTVNIQNYSLSTTTNYNPNPGVNTSYASNIYASAKPLSERNPPPYEAKPRPTQPDPVGTYDQLIDRLRISGSDDAHNPPIDKSKLPRPRQ